MSHDIDRMHALAEHTLSDFTSEDAAMRSCLDLARLAAKTELAILILGESGTGKTLLARAIHNSSRRRDASFISFNAAALSDTLLDSQLFGHEKGAFTGATRCVKGKFELAHRGTLFIDEIADMSAVAQAKILRAVEYGEFERLGSEALQIADVRLISATHLPIGRFGQSDNFRQDLFYRISGITLSVPPLRLRPNDLRSLVAAEIASAAAREKKVIAGLSKRAADMLFSYRWPGNLREMKRVVHTAVAMSEGDIIQPEAVLLESSDPHISSGERTGSRMDGDRINETDVPVPAATVIVDGASSDSPADTDLTLSAAELRHIRKVLSLTHGNKRQAAKILGLSRSTLARKMDVIRSL
ncbi:MAG: sigma 54-interacting transcriptional regulator [Anaerolineae bacterium]|nr:sigma 54-interacting transcriptional regulator [Gemmatimonadaceae bacterium]